MPAPIEVVTAYERAKQDARKAAAMVDMGIDHTIKYWATANESAHNIVKGFLLSAHTA